MQIFRLSKLVTLSTILLWSASVAFCQGTPADRTAVPDTAKSKLNLSFDVASIREAHEGNMSYYDNMPNTSYFHGERITAMGLILAAYHLKLIQQIEKLPAWAWDTRYNITAKADAPTDEALAKMSESDSYTEKRFMLQKVLAERFNLQIHPETRITTTYELVATERAAKLMTHIPGSFAKTLGTCSPRYTPQKGVEIDSKGCPFPILFSTIQQELGTDVVNRTGMTEAYAFHLMYKPSSVTAQDNSEWYPLITDAVREQLGLELKRTKGPVTYWVVDHIERPTDN